MERRLAPLYENVRKVIIGKDEVVKFALIALLAKGHLLIEDAPGLGKTMLARSLARSLGLGRRLLTPENPSPLLTHCRPHASSGTHRHRYPSAAFTHPSGETFQALMPLWW